MDEKLSTNADYTGKGKPRVISLHTQSTCLSECVTDYVIRTEAILAALRNIGQTVNVALIIAMILKGLPRHSDSFSFHVTYSNKELTFSELKTELYSFEETLKHRDCSRSDNFMKLTSSFLKAMKHESRDGRDVSYFTCN